MHTYIHACMRAYIHVCRHTCIRILTRIHAHARTYTHTYIHTYIDALYIHVIVMRMHNIDKMYMCTLYIYMAIYFFGGHETTYVK